MKLNKFKTHTTHNKRCSLKINAQSNVVYFYIFQSFLCQLRFNTGLPVWLLPTERVMLPNANYPFSKGRLFFLRRYCALSFLQRFSLCYLLFFLFIERLPSPDIAFLNIAYIFHLRHLGFFLHIFI